MSLADLSRVFGTGLYWYSGQVQSGGEVVGLLKIGESLRDDTASGASGVYRKFLAAEFHPAVGSWGRRGG